MVKHLLLTFVFIALAASASAQTDFSFDINRMSPDVQHKISLNKQTGKPLFDGVGKSYSIQVKDVFSIRDVEVNYGFLKENNQVLEIQYLEKNKIEVTVTSEYPSEQLKEIFIQRNRIVNFLDEYFKVMKLK